MKPAEVQSEMITYPGQNGTKINAYLLDLKLTHQDLANLIGVARETISVAMKKLEKQNKVMHRNGFLLLDDKYAPSSPRTS